MMRRLLLELDIVVASLSLSVVVGSVIWGVLTRYILSQPATWTTELSAIAFAWVVFFGAAAALRRGMLISIPLVVDLFPSRIRKLIAICAGALVVAFLVYTTYLAYTLAGQASNRPSPVLRISFFYVYGGIALSLLIMSGHAIAQFVVILRSRGGGIFPQADEQIESL
ncbi:TRAP transporter small permease [Mesorhizobium sp. CAU 1732]|uniref:TRAP transporter small permease n=1 Tax=Mesorhizobium sp. CAU 1732 TaxID=3140358 RepID=UPI00326033F8